MNGPIAEATLEQALRAHFRRERDEDVRALEAIALTLTRGGPAVVPDDPDLAAALEALARGPVAPRRRARWAFLGGAAAVLAALLLFALRPTAELSPKGVTDQLHVAVGRGSARFFASSGAPLVAGDRLGFFATTESAAWVWVGHVDARGHVVSLERGRSTAGPMDPLPDGAVYEGGDGCEWIVGVFSDHDLGVSALEAWLGELVRARARSTGCRLEAANAGARAVRVFEIAPAGEGR